MPFRPVHSIYTLVGILLLPFCLSSFLALGELLREIRPESASVVPVAVWWMVAGFVFWMLLFMVLPRPVRTYVLAHELTHALCGFLMGARVSKLSVSAKGGSVHVSKTNPVIVLAPYFIPLYTLLVLVAYGVVSIFKDLGAYEPFLLGLVGLTWGFHLSFTLKTLSTHQSDLELYGPLFSYVFILFLNILGICFWVVGVASPTLDGFVEVWSRETAATWGWLWAHGKGGLGWLAGGR